MPLRPTLPITTERLVLRPVTASDAADMLAYRSIPDVCRYVPFEPMTQQTLDAFLGRVVGRHVLEGDDDAMFLAAEYDGTVIGDLMLRLVSETSLCAEVGYVFHPAHGGSGLATEAARAVVQCAFDLGMHRVIAKIDTRNDASVRLVQRLGMREEGHFLESEWFKGGWTDTYEFAVLEQEWAGA